VVTELTVYSDDCQIHLSDSGSDCDPGAVWQHDFLSVDADDAVALATNGYGYIPVTVETYNSAPADGESFEAVYEFSLRVQIPELLQQLAAATDMATTEMTEIHLINNTRHLFGALLFKQIQFDYRRYLRRRLGNRGPSTARTAALDQYLVPARPGRELHAQQHLLRGEGAGSPAADSRRPRDRRTDHVVVSHLTRPAADPRVRNCRARRWRTTPRPVAADPYGGRGANPPDPALRVYRT
jgi:hypothetical protein